MNKDKQYLSVVNGNDFTLNIHVTKYNADNQSFIDYRMDNCSQVVCFLVAVTGGRRYKLPITVSGNVLTADIDGSMLNVGVYGLELLFEDAESHSKRSYEPALLKIVRTNAEATYTQADFDSEDDCRLHMTIQANASFITIGAPTADTQIDATSYNAVSNAAVADAITNLQQQIDTIGSEILDPASVFTKEETEALIDEMIDAQEMSEYVSYVASYYTTNEQFDSSYNSLSERITAIEDNPTDISNLVSYDYLSQQAYLQASALNGYATQAYVDEKVAAVDVSDQLADFVSKEELNSAAYLQSGDLNGYATESYVVDKINAIAPTDISGLVSYEFLTAQAYLQADDISDVVRDSDLADFATKSYVSQQIEAIPAPDLSAYATQEFVSQQIAAIPQPDLSTYITETELANTLTSYAQLADLISNERVVSTALNSLADRIETVEGDYVSDDDLDEALLPYATEAYVVEKIDSISPADLTEYVSKNFLSQQAYLQADDISDVVRDSDLVSAGYLTAEDVAEMGYITAEEINNASYLQSDDLNGYATESYVAEKIDSIAPADLTEYVSKNYLAQQAYLQADDISDVVRDSDLATAGYITESDVAQMGYLTAADVAEMGYLTESDLTSAGYLTESDVAQMGYVTSTDLSSAGYVTATDLASAGYVTTTEISNAGYVTATEISNSGYVTATEISNAGYVTATEISNAGYLTESDVAAMGYITESDVSAMGYITESDVSAMGYITANDVAAMGYVTTTALDTALSSYAKVSDIEDNEQVISTALNTLSDRIGLVENDYVSDDDLDDALSAYASKSYVDEKISGITPTDLSSYVSKEELTAAGYITANDVAAMGYVTDTELANASYVTNTALNTTLSSYVTTTDVPYKFVVLSYAQYTALSVKDQNTIYMIPEE